MTAGPLDLYCRAHQSEDLVFRPLNWGIAGTGRISSLFADCITRTESGTVGHVLSRSQDSAIAFCERQGGTPWSNQREMLGVDGLDALYIGTPHSEHAELAVAALSVGIPVLCEKPMTCSPAGSLAVVMCAHQNGTALIEGWMYRCHPQIERLIELISSGAIGELQTIESHFGFRADVSPEHRLRSQKLGGGPILDIGGYPMSLAMLVAGSTDDRAHARPKSMEAVGVFDTETEVEADAAAVVTFDNGLEAKLRCSLIEDLGTGLRCTGTDGEIRLPQPFLAEARQDGRRATIEIERHGQTEIERFEASLDCFSLEARTMSELVASGELEPPRPMVSHEESVVIAGALESWRSCLQKAKEDG